MRLARRTHVQEAPPSMEDIEHGRNTKEDERGIKLANAVSQVLWATGNTVPTPEMADVWWVQWQEILSQHGAMAGRWVVEEDSNDKSSPVNAEVASETNEPAKADLVRDILPVVVIAARRGGETRHFGFFKEYGNTGCG